MIINQEIILIIIFIVVVYFNYKITKLEQKKIEGFDTVQDEAITTAVKKIYLADVEAIRILSNFAIQLSQGGYTIPGNITISNKLTTNGFSPNDFPNGWGGGLRTFDIYASGTIGVGADDKVLKAYLNKDGEIYAATNIITDGPLDVSGTTTCRDKLITSNSIIMNDKPIILRVATDSNHIIQFAGDQINGPRISGWDGGVLSLRQNNNDVKDTLKWNKDGIIVNGTITCDNIKSNINNICLAGYIFDTNMPIVSNYAKAYPIICSLKFGLADITEHDDAWLLNPGYKVELFDEANYGGTKLNIFDNKTGDKPKLYNLHGNSTDNKTGSWKVYFNDTEVTIEGMSY